MKRRIAFLLALLLTIALGGCAALPAEEKLTVVATNFAEYDWAREVLGAETEAELILLTKNGTELHSYQPTPEDIVTIAQCDLFIYTASEQLPWLQDVLKNTANPERIALDLAAVLGDRMLREQPMEGMEHSHSDHSAWDQHIWLSLKNAQLCVRAIQECLTEIDPAQKDLYQKNAELYLQKLKQLDTLVYKEVFAGAPTLLFTDRFPFRYLAEDYGITCYAAFPGCSAETNADFDTVLFLAEKLKEKNLSAVLTVDGQNQALAQTVIETAGVTAKILTVDSMQSVTASEIQSGKTYYSTMAENIEVFKTALS